MEFAKRVEELKPEGAYHVLSRAKQLEAEGMNIIHLEIGQPDVDTFAHIAKAGQAAIAEGATRYTPPNGIAGLREAIAEDAGRRRGVHFSPEQVVIGPGAKPGLVLSVLAVIQAKDEVLYPEPGFPTYPAMIRMAGGKPVPIPLIEEDNFALDLKALKGSINARTKMIVLNSPSNPTGGVLGPETIEQILSLAVEHDLWLLSDEIYSRMVYEGVPFTSIASYPESVNRTILVDGFSKTYAMTGWRLGYAIAPSKLAERISLLNTHVFGCTAEFTQVAGVEAITGPQEEIQELRHAYQKRRNLIVAGLSQLPNVACQLPEGAFYAFPNIKSTGMTSDRLATRLLEEAGVALLPGTAFGALGEGYLRISYATSSEHLTEALERMHPILSHI